jgi:hypothetical protein
VSGIKHRAPYVPAGARHIHRFRSVKISQTTMATETEMKMTVTVFTIRALTITVWLCATCDDRSDQKSNVWVKV